MSALFIHQLLILPQIIDSREGLFRCQTGKDCACGKMNFYLKKTSFAPFSGLFGAKLVRFAAKCSAF